MRPTTTNRLCVVNPLQVGVLSLLLAACGSSGGGSAPATNPAPTATEPTLGFGLKTFRFSWTDSSGADFYRLFEDLDGVSGFTQANPDVAAGVQGTITSSHCTSGLMRVTS